VKGRGEIYWRILASIQSKRAKRKRKKDGNWLSGAKKLLSL